jgi:hypothetical protein
MKSSVAEAERGARPTSSYHRGDQVLATWPLDRWGRTLTCHGRVVRVRGGRVKVAAYQPGVVEVSTRLIPTGTPSYAWRRPEDLVLVGREPTWNLFGYMPALRPEEYTCIEGRVGAVGGYPGLTQVGAYQPATVYDPGDPVWAWVDDGWRPAKVIDAKRSWIMVRYLDAFKNRNGRPSGSHRPPTIWPVICDQPFPNARFAKEYHG